MNSVRAEWEPSTRRATSTSTRGSLSRCCAPTSLAALFAEPPEAAAARIAEAARHWREVTAREAPSIERIATAGTLVRVDTDLVSGYLAVVTPEETWRAFVDRPQLGTILALLLRQPLASVEVALAEGPVTLKPTEPAPPT